MVGLKSSEILQLASQGITPALPAWPPMAIDIVRQCLSLDTGDRPAASSLTEMLSLAPHVLFPPQPLPEERRVQPVQGPFSCQPFFVHLSSCACIRYTLR